MTIHERLYSDESQGTKDKISAGISERLNKLDLGGPVAVDGSTSALTHPEDNHEPRIVPIAHGGSRVESTISNSQIAPGRDMNMNMNSYHFTINNYEESGPATVQNDKIVLQERVNIDDDDDIASGMLVPPPPSCILERDAQHDQIVAKLASTIDARVAILGMGGIGKTTLACSVANDVQIVETYPRRLFVSFEGCSTADLAYTNLATVFQCPVDRRSSHRQILSHVLNYLKQTKTLLIIDNFETFWEVPSNRRAAEDFLNHLAALRELAMIVTLRGIQRPGNIRWMKIDPLQTLTDKASKELLFFIVEEEYSEGYSEYIQHLLKAVAGIPLAVTLIGSLLRDESETPQSLWNQWTRESARAIRVTNAEDSDDRLYKLDISLRLSIFSPRMSDNAKETLAAISILPIGLSMDEKWLDDLQSLLPRTIHIRDCIRTLKNVALATLDSSASPHRLRLLPPLRDFCLNNLHLCDEVTLRLIDKYIADLDIYYDCGSGEAYTWATAELSNINAMLNHALNIRYVTDNLGVAIYTYTEWRGFLCMPDIATLEQAIDVLSELPAAQSRCLQSLGTMLSDFNRRQEALPHLEQALYIHKELGNTSEVAMDLFFIGKTHLRLGDYNTAERFAIDARNLFVENDVFREASALQLLADIYCEQEKYAQSECTAKEALELCRASSDRMGEMDALLSLGWVYSMQGKYDLAVESLITERDVSQATHDTHGEARANRGLGYVYRDTNKPDQAVLHFRLALSLYKRAQDHDGVEDVRAALEELEASSNDSG